MAVDARAGAVGAGAVTTGAGAGTVGDGVGFFFNTTQLTITTIITIKKTILPAVPPAMIPTSMILVATTHKDGRTVTHIDRHTQAVV